MIYTFHPGAVMELLYALDQYENNEPGFGVDFVIEVHSAIETIQMLLSYL